MVSERSIPMLLLTAVASAIVTALIAVLSVTKTISPEWFFGGPVIGAGLTGIAVESKLSDRLMTRPKRAVDAIERFEQARQQRRAEKEVELDLRRERDQLLYDLNPEQELGLVKHLGYDSMIQYLRHVEARRRTAVSEQERLLREQALARADLIVAAQEQGIQGAHRLEPDELVSAVAKEENPAKARAQAKRPPSTQPPSAP